jgi:hypothetical protein
VEPDSYSSGSTIVAAMQSGRFFDGGASDIGFATSTNGGANWTNGFLPGTTTFSSPPGPYDRAVDKNTSGTTAHLGLGYYYYYPNTNCTFATCQLRAGFISSNDGGATWSAPIEIAAPMMLKWLPNTSQGRMVGDYISSSFVNGTARPIYAVARQPTGGGSTDCAVATPNCDQATYTSATGLAGGGTASSSEPEQPVPNAVSDHPAPTAPVTRHYAQAASDHPRDGAVLALLSAPTASIV